jgi:hypothetical protein
MIPHRAFFLVTWALIPFAAGCRGDTGTSKTDSASSTSASAVPIRPLPANTGWQEDEAGPALVLSDSASTSAALVVLPSLSDSVMAGTKVFNADSLTGMSFDLFGRPGSAGPAILTAGSRSSNSEGCVSWPAGTVTGNIQRTWRFGLKRGLATAIPLDSLEGMTSADSVQVTTELARLASSLTVRSDPAFEGLPFSVRKAYRGTLGKRMVLVGDVIRKINEEANPREEHLLLIAERGPASDVPYIAVFQSRAAGSEEIVRTSEILGALKFLNGRAAIVVSFNYENGGRVALIERVSDSEWKLTWRSAYTGC